MPLVLCINPFVSSVITTVNGEKKHLPVTKYNSINVKNIFTKAI